MNLSVLEGQEKFANPEQELSRLREAATNRVEQAKTQNLEVAPHEAAHEVVKQYARVSPEKVLHSDLAMPEKETAEIVLQLSPEAHDKQMEELVGMLHEKGVRNTLSVVEKMNNPHLLDDFHRFLIQLIATQYPLTGLKEKDELWKP